MDSKKKIFIDSLSNAIKNIPKIHLRLDIAIEITGITFIHSSAVSQHSSIQPNTKESQHNFQIGINNVNIKYLCF